MAIVVVGLVLFETVSSIDNAVINADVLSSVGPRARRFFITWGIFIAVFLVRGLLPWVIVYFTVPELGFLGSLTAPVLLMGGGIFLIFLFFHWLFLEKKYYGLFAERYFERQAAWFYAAVSLVLAVIVWYALKEGPMVAFGAVVGSTAFFIVHGFRHQAEETERRMVGSSMSDVSKILYLEVIDLSFSIDGVLGAFAFTLSVPLILLGNGIGAIIVRQLTVANIDRVKRYLFLKNGAMYSIVVLGIVMVAEGFRMHVPEWLAPAATFLIIGYFFRKSRRAILANDPALAPAV
jgi:hypothetical protein